MLPLTHKDAPINGHGNGDTRPSTATPLRPAGKRNPNPHPLFSNILPLNLDARSPARHQSWPQSAEDHAAEAPQAEGGDFEGGPQSGSHRHNRWATDDGQSGLDQRPPR